MGKSKYEKEFMNLIKEYTDWKFYVPTDEHSSGFNMVEITDWNDTYDSDEENECTDSNITFEDLVNKYPKFALMRDYAYYEKWTTWQEFKDAIDGKIEIDLLRL